MPEADSVDIEIEPPRLRSLRILVTVLTGTMIAGVLTIVVLLVISMTRTPPVEIGLPDTLTLPAGETATAFTQGRNWIGVVTLDGGGAERIHLFNRDGTPRQTIEITQ